MSRADIERAAKLRVNDIDPAELNKLTEPASSSSSSADSGGEKVPEVDAQEIASKLVLDTKSRGPGITDAVARDVFEDAQDVNAHPEVYAMRDDTIPDTSPLPTIATVVLTLIVASAVYKGDPLPFVGVYPTLALRWVHAALNELSTVQWCFITLTPVLVYFYYIWCWRPLEYTRKLIHKPVKRSVGTLPPPYPNGWFKVADSHELVPGALKSLKVLGQELVLFRGYGGVSTTATNSRHTLDSAQSAKDMSGPGVGTTTTQAAVHVLDAFCPHLGANLAVGGKVTGDCVECPFHGWLFRGSDGKCTHIPYSNGTIPASAKTRSWPVRELNGCIYLWHDLDSRPPQWEPVPFPASTHPLASVSVSVCGSGTRTSSGGSAPPAGSATTAEMAASAAAVASPRTGGLGGVLGCDGGMRWHGRTRHYVGAHIQEIPENGVDLAHFHHLHTPLFSFFRFKWDAIWTPSKLPGEAHITNMRIDTQLTVFGYTLPFIKFSCHIQQIGPGVVHLLFRYPFGRLLCVESVTPMAPLLQRCEHTMFADWWVPRFIPKAVLKVLSLQFERDVPIWSNKQLLNKPLLVKEDGRVVQFRRWYKQFYASAKGLKRREALDW